MRAAVPALVVTLEVSVMSSGRPLEVTWPGILAGVGYLVAVFVLGVVLARQPGATDGSRQDVAGRASTLSTQVSAVNSLLGLSTVVLLYGVSRTTSVAVGNAPQVVAYPWFPWWLAFVATLALAWRTVVRLRRRGGHPAIARVEVRTLLIVGALTIFMTTAFLPGALGPFQGFDDAEYLAGPQLVFGHGLTPWSQFVPFHGLLFDVFGSALGMVVFGNTRRARWPANRCSSSRPCGSGSTSWPWYFFTRRRLFAAAFAVAVTAGVFGAGIDYRWLLLPYLFVALHKAIRTDTRGWTALFTVAVLVQAILVPESDLITASLLATLVLFELATRLGARRCARRCLAPAGASPRSWCPGRCSGCTCWRPAPWAPLSTTTAPSYPSATGSREASRSATVGSS